MQIFLIAILYLWNQGRVFHVLQGVGVGDHVQGKGGRMHVQVRRRLAIAVVVKQGTKSLELLASRVGQAARPRAHSCLIQQIVAKCAGKGPGRMLALEQFINQ